MGVDDLLQNALQLFLADHEVNFQLQIVIIRLAIDEAQVLGDDLIEYETAQSRLNLSGVLSSIGKLYNTANIDLGVEVDDLVLLGEKSLVGIGEMLALAGLAVTLLGQIEIGRAHV